MSPELEPIHDDAGFERFIGDFTSYERLKDFRYDEESLKLERMGAFAAALGDPQTSYPSVHIAGTKGKGTTCLILEALLSRTHDPVGCYMSPHVEHIRERIRFAARMIGETDLCEMLNGMLPTLNRLRALGPRHFPTFFELMTGLAMVHFRDRRARQAIFEVGLGGRLDATNILSPAWTVITSIALEHTQKLGSTLAKIAGEKAGILKPGVPVVVGSLGPEARSTVLERAAGLDCPVHEAPSHAVRRDRFGRLEIDGLDGTFLPGPIRGPGLRDDLAVATTVWRGILRSDGARARSEDVERALEHLTLPARVEVFECDPPVVVDGAHTAESIRVLRIALEEIEFPRPRRLLLSVAADKRLSSILREIDGVAEEVFLTRGDALRSRSPAEVARAYREVCGVDIPAERLIDDPREAFERAYEGGRPVVITGSLYLAGELRPRVREIAMASPGL